MSCLYNRTKRWSTTQAILVWWGPLTQQHKLHTQQAQLRWIHVESTSWPDVVSTLIFGSIWKLNQRLVFHVDSTSFFPLWFHVFSTLNPRVFNVESTWCFPRWINVRTPRGFHVDIWFYMKVDSMSSFQRWIYVMFSTLNPHIISQCCWDGNRPMQETRPH